jgi:hypothetical protein
MQHEVEWVTDDTLDTATQIGIYHSTLPQEVVATAPPIHNSI